MFYRQKSVRDQVVVITGATSGIGLATARMAAKRGARLVLAARHAKGLQEVADRLGGSDRVLTVAADICSERPVTAALRHR